MQTKSSGTFYLLLTGTYPIPHHIHYITSEEPPLGKFHLHSHSWIFIFIAVHLLPFVYNPESFFLTTSRGYSITCTMLIVNISVMVTFSLNN